MRTVSRLTQSDIIKEWLFPGLCMDYLQQKDKTIWKYHYGCLQYSYLLKKLAGIVSNKTIGHDQNVCGWNILRLLKLLSGYFKAAMNDYVLKDPYASLFPKVPREKYLLHGNSKNVKSKCFRSLMQTHNKTLTMLQWSFLCMCSWSGLQWLGGLCQNMRLKLLWKINVSPRRH